MAIKISGTTVINDSRNIENVENITATGNVNFAGGTSLRIPSGTTSQRPASPLTGELRFNTQTNNLEQYNGTAWATTVPQDLDINSVRINNVVVIDSDRQVKNVTNINNIIKKPVNIFPADGGSDYNALTGPLEITPYLNLFGTAQSAEYQISLTEDFATTVVDTFVTSNINQLTFDVRNILDDGQTTYYWRARYKDTDNNVSLYSDPTEFVTSLEFVTLQTPTITSVAGGGVVRADQNFQITSSTFTVLTSTSTHTTSDWQIATDPGFTNLVVNAQGSSSLTTLTVSSGTLGFNTEFYVRVRYNGTGAGQSEFSQAAAFATLALFAPGTLSFAGGPNTTFANNLITLSFDDKSSWNEELFSVDNSTGEPFQVVVNASNITASNFDLSQVGGTSTTSGHSSNIRVFINNGQVFGTQIYNGDWTGGDGQNGTVTNRGFTFNATNPSPGTISVIFNGNTFLDNRADGTAFVDYDATFNTFQINPL